MLLTFRESTSSRICGVFEERLENPRRVLVFSKGLYAANQQRPEE